MDHTWKCPFRKDCERFRHNRKLSPVGKAFSSYFLNFGYSIDAYEVLLNYRSVSSTVESPLDKTKGVGALLGGKDKLESSSTTTSISLGVGYRF